MGLGNSHFNLGISLAFSVVVMLSLTEIISLDFFNTPSLTVEVAVFTP